MKVLLLNDNPVVDRLVTLSAEKRKDDLVKVKGHNALEAGHYDLLIVEESSAASHLPEEIADNVKYGYTLFIAARATAVLDMYDSTLSKPFLPTELLGVFQKADDLAELKHADPEDENREDELFGDEIEELSVLERPFDEDDLLAEDEDDLLAEDEDEILESILNDDDVQAVQDLLGDFEEDEQSVEEIHADEEIIDLDEQITRAMNALSQEDLARTVDEEILFDIANEAEGLETDTSIWDAVDNSDDYKDTSTFEEILPEAPTDTEHFSEPEPTEKGSEALQKILGMLADPEIAASLKAMNITVKISFGDKE